MAKARVEHEATVAAPPLPKRVVLEMTWDEFLIVHSLIGAASPAVAARSVKQTLEYVHLYTSVSRKRTDLVVDTEERARKAVADVYNQLRPIYLGDVN